MYTSTVVACWRLFHQLVFWGLRVWFWCKSFLYLLCHPFYAHMSWICVSLVQLSLFCVPDWIKEVKLEIFANIFDLVSMVERESYWWERGWMSFSWKTIHQDYGREFNGTQIKYRLFINQFGFWNQMKVREQCFSSLGIFWQMKSEYGKNCAIK